MTAVLEDVRVLDDTVLADLYHRAAADDAVAARVALGELGRRDAADRAARARGVLDGIRAEAEVAVHAQYLAASEWTRGRLLSRAGVAAGIAERDLWRMPADRVARFGSEELNDYFKFVQPRLTVAAYVRQQAAERRAARIEALEADASEDITDDEWGVSTDDEDDQHDASGPGLARDDAGAFRLVPAAAEAPEAGSRGTVQRGGRGRTGAEAGQHAGAGAGRPDGPIRRDGVSDMTRAKTFAEIEETDQPWLWPGYVPEGLLTVLIAPPGASKTTLVSEIAARVSRGDCWPDGTPGMPAAPVIMAALEDAAESSMIHKLKAARADLGNVVDASGGPDGDGLELTLDHVAWLREVAAEHPGAALIVVDTLSASATRPITTHTGLKAMLKPLGSLARATGAAVILTAHTRKDGEPAGGQALISIPRHLLKIDRSKDTPGERTLSVLKSNVTADDGEGIRYSLAGAGPATTIEWAWDAVRHGTGPDATGQARMLLLLRNSPVPLSAQLISAKTGIKYAVARVLLHRMMRRGEVISPGRGTYAVPDAREATA